jgi:hypothetical protein
MLKFLPFIAPKEFVFRDPDTDYEYRANTKEALIKHIVSYRSQNGLEPIEHLNVVLENYWCSLPENVGSCQEYKLQRGWFATWRGAVQVVKNVFYGEDNLVEPEEADRRAGICVKCPENVFPDKGPFIAWSDELAQASTGGRKSKHYNELGNCAICSCPLKAKVWAKHAKLTEDENLKAPDFCWQKRV